MKTRITIIIAAIAVVVSCTPPAPETLEDAVKAISEKKAEIKALEVQLDSLKVLRDRLDTAKTDEEVYEVYLTELKKKTFESFVEVHGVVESDKNIVVMPEMSGVVRSISVKEGSIVRKGQKLASVDTEIIRNQIAELEKRLELAVELFTKQENLRKENVGTEIAYLEAKNNKESLEQSIKSLKTQMSKAVITSPIDGKVDEVIPNLGEMISPAQPFCRIVNTSDVYINSDVSEALLNKIEKGQEVRVRFPYQKDTTQLKVEYVGNYINPNNRTFKVHTSLSGATKKYPPNLLAVVEFQDERVEDVFIVPSNVVQNNGTHDYVYIIKGGVAKQIKVETGASYLNETILISDELKPGDKLVSRGYRRLSEGAKVKEVKEVAAK